MATFREMRDERIRLQHKVQVYEELIAKLHPVLSSDEREEPEYVFHAEGCEEPVVGEDAVKEVIGELSGVVESIQKDLAKLDGVPLGGRNKQ